ncbi:TPA: hypothetical protein ACGXMH_001356 [Bacillus mobilis]|uniref:hypothetical protein n=1 Tax=Bacillus mobilis TaxID=2026190 RepID=UPI0011A001F3|nr:hypothetical protein [Bacillus mobilis]MED4385014.1 hypothetical protein [Bacillus mobilis]HDX9638966.1 hypothetical protein [Bacillus mobilis]
MNDRLTKEDAYEKREMSTRKKINSTFKCSICSGKVNIQTHKYFYLVNEYLTNQFDSGRYCSKECVLKFLEDRNVDVEEAVKEHNRMMDLLDELDKK